MRRLNEYASNKEIIKAINDLVISYGSLRDTIINISNGNQNVYFKNEINDLKKKIIDQGDLFVSHINDFHKS